jgi:hypothetical protein
MMLGMSNPSDLLSTMLFAEGLGIELRSVLTSDGR